MYERVAVVEPKGFSHEDEEPMEIVVTEAGSITASLYALLRQALPVLENPESVHTSYRQNLVDAIRMELDGLNGEDDPGNEFDSEP